MSIETYQFNLPITPGAIPPVLHLSQYDSGRTFTAILRDDANVPFELDSGATAVIKGRNAAGIAWQQSCTVSGANVTFTPSGAATDQFGVMPVTIEITESEEIISPLCVVFHIQKAGYTNEEAVLSPDFETAIQAAVAQALATVGILLAENQEAKTSTMTEAVGVDEYGKLWVEGGWSDEAKQLLIGILRNGLYSSDQSSNISALESALEGEVTLESITAAYDQDRPIYDTDSLDLVRLDLVVTANYSDGTTETLADDAYTLTGTLTAGTSTITVTYLGKTATFDVTVTHRDVPRGYTQYDYIKYTGSSKQTSLRTEFIKTKEFNLNAVVLDFDCMPIVAQTGSTGQIMGGRTTSGNDNVVAIYGRTDTKRVSAFSHGTAIGINDNPNMAVNSKVHINLNPGGSSPATLTVDQLSETGAWSSSVNVSTPVGYCGTYNPNADNLTLSYFVAIGVLNVRDLSNTLVGKYFPCVRDTDNVIGIYDSVTNDFYTAETVAYATIGNGSCEYAVGNWT